MRTPHISSRLRIVTGIAALYAVPAASVALAAAPGESAHHSEAVIAAADHLDQPAAAPPAGGYAANGGHDLYDPMEQARVTATMLAHGQAWQWACANR
jgi:hypothetical protein